LDPLTSAKEIFQYFRNRINSIYTLDEAESISFLILKEYLGISRMDVITNKSDLRVSKPKWSYCYEVLDRLERHEPIQYIIGETEFLGCRIIVNPTVLIPRPETEELVDLILKENRERGNLVVLDICTGSGCIPIALASNLPSSSCYGLDVSEQALDTAKGNATLNNVSVQFEKIDILKGRLPFSPVVFDIIISNPPYVRESEKTKMQKNVLDYEPSLALFVSDSDPLIFYKRIIEGTIDRLASNGKLYLEINEKFGQEVSQLMKRGGFTDIRLIQDLFGKDRFVTGRAV
jgi:release factor glutamine methyltransferase